MVAPVVFSAPPSTHEVFPMTRSIRCALLVCIFLSVAAGECRAQLDVSVQKPGDLFVHVFGGAQRSNTIYTADGDSRLFDTLGTSYSAVLFGPSVDYGVIDGLEVNVDMPIGYLSVTSDEKFPDRSIFAPLFIGVGATGDLTAGEFVFGLSSMIKLPSGWHRGIYDDPEHPSFLSDGYLQWTTLARAGFSHDKVRASASVGYNWRDEEPLDEIAYSAQIGLESVRGSGVFVGVDGVQSTGDVTNPLRPFYAGSSGSAEQLLQSDGGSGRLLSIDRENYTAVSAGAYATVFDRLVIDGRYELRLSGANTIALQGAFLGVGYTFHL